MKKVIGLILIGLLVGCSNPTGKKAQVINTDSVLSIYANMPYVVDTKETAWWPDCQTSSYSWAHWDWDSTACNKGWGYVDIKVWRTVHPGDVNYDEGVDIEDLTQLIAYVNCEPVSSYFVAVGADFNQDSYIDIEDVMGLIDFLYISGWPAYPDHCNSNKAPYQGCDPALEPFIPSGDTTQWIETWCE